MATSDRTHWDERYSGGTAADAGDPAPPVAFGPFEHLFPTQGVALELACGRGLGSVWLACQGMEVLGLDVSPVALAQARDLASHHGVSDTCRFEQVDFDDGLVPGPPADVIMMHLFWDPLLVGALVDRLAPGGLLAAATLSEVDSEPGRFRLPRGGLTDAFSGLVGLETLAEGEGEGTAWYIAKRSSR